MTNMTKTGNQTIGGADGDASYVMEGEKGTPVSLRRGKEKCNSVMITVGMGRMKKQRENDGLEQIKVVNVMRKGEKGRNNKERRMKTCIWKEGQQL